MAANASPSNGLILRELDRLDKGQEKLWKEKASRDDVSEIKKLQIWVICTLVGFAFTVAGSAILYALNSGTHT